MLDETYPLNEQMKDIALQRNNERILLKVRKLTKFDCLKFTQNVPSKKSTSFGTKKTLEDKIALRCSIRFQCDNVLFISCCGGSLFSPP